MKKTRYVIKRSAALLIAVIMALSVCLSFTSCVDENGEFNGLDSVGDILDSVFPETDGSTDKNDGSSDEGNGGDENNDGGSPGDVVVGNDFEVHFLELGNKYTGDCTYIKAGDNDILIDAGSKTSSISTIHNYLSEHVTDGKLEYVIVTHAHEDHFAGFATYDSQESIFDLYECEVIIDFAQIEKGRETKAMYKRYIKERDAEIAAGAVHYNAAQCVQMGGIFDLGDGMSLEVLDSYYYYNVSSDENEHSVCVMLNDGKNNYLFTGDLEKDGEEKLVEMNDLPKVKLFKAGHHGSKTSSSAKLLSVIQPEIVCVCCCCGSPEYTDTKVNQFPTQDFINRVAVYTDKVYVTTLCVDYKNGKFTSMNGNIVIKSVSGEVTVSFSASSQKLKDSEWFKNNRTCPSAWK